MRPAPSRIPVTCDQHGPLATFNVSCMVIFVVLVLRLNLLLAEDLESNGKPPPNIVFCMADAPRVSVDGYTPRNIEGWPVRISDVLTQSNPEATNRALELLATQLRTVRDVLPTSALAKVRSVPIWLSPEYDGFGPTGEYHPDAGWLKDQRRHPELHRCVEFTNISIFEREIERMPMMVLHELAHAYHHQVLGFDHPGIKGAYERAKKSGKYDAVRRGNGKTERAYALTDHKEYFAESTEAFFGINDFYPFKRSDLVEQDPRMADLLSRLWSDKDRIER